MKATNKIAIFLISSCLVYVNHVDAQQERFASWSENSGIEKKELLKSGIFDITKEDNLKGFPPDSGKQVDAQQERLGYWSKDSRIEDKQPSVNTPGFPGDFGL